MDPVNPADVRGLRYHTARDEAWPTIGPRQADFGRIWLGRTFMPFQRLISDVAGEYDPETGLPRHRLVVVTAQRQAGKSDLVMVQSSERAFSRSPHLPPFRGWYTAQSGQDARDQFLKFETDVLDGTPLGYATRFYRGNGNERLTWPTKASIRCHPPTEKKLHGKQSDRNDIDEAWAFTREEGKALMQAIAPTQVTRPGAQTFIWSAGGTPESTWLADYVARGRDGDPRVCYFEFAAPDDVDLEDIEAVAQHHPAYGHTVTLDSLRTLRDSLDESAEWARAGANLWTQIIGGAISGPLWTGTAWTDPIPDHVPVAYGAACSLDGSHTAVALAARIGDNLVVELYPLLDGTWGVAQTVHELAPDGPLVVVGEGPTLPLSVDLGRIRPRGLVTITGKDYAVATGNVLSGLKARGVWHRASPDLDASATAAGTRPHQDGGLIWSRVQAGGSIAALEAMTAAVHGLMVGATGGRARKPGGRAA